MRKLSFIFAFFLLKCIYGIEDFEPPRRPAEVDVALDEARNASPSDFENIFEKPFRFFLSQDNTALKWHTMFSGGMNGLRGAGGLSNNNMNFAVEGCWDTITTPQVSTRANGAYSTAIARKVSLSTAFAAQYNKREYMGWYPRCYGGRIGGKAVSAMKSILLATDFFADGFMRNNYPETVETEKESRTVFGKYREIVGGADFLAYGFLSPEVGVWGATGYSVSRRGDELTPESGHTGVLGAFLFKMPFTLKIAAAAMKIREDEKITFGPTAEVRWVGYRISAVAAYGMGLTPYSAREFSSDATVDPSQLRLSNVETLGVYIRYESHPISLSAAGCYGTSSEYPYCIPDSTFGFVLHTAETKVAMASGALAFSDTISDFPIKNITSIAVNRSKFHNGHPLPMVPKFVAADTLFISPFPWAKIWTMGEYNSGFFMENNSREWKEKFYFFSAGVEFRWQILRVALWSENITKQTIYEKPYFPHRKREIQLAIGVEHIF